MRQGPRKILGTKRLSLVFHTLLLTGKRRSLGKIKSLSSSHATALVILTKNHQSLELGCSFLDIRLHQSISKFSLSVNKITIALRVSPFGFNRLK